MTSLDGQARVREIARDLATSRNRGITHLDDTTRGGQGPRDIPVLEQLARAYGADPTGPRIPLVRQLLDDALQAYKAQDDQGRARFIRRLFEDEQGRWPGPRRPAGLMELLRQEERLGKEAMRKHVQDLFERFAAFLAAFVADQTSRQGDAVGTPIAGSASGPRRRAVAAAVLAIVVTVILTIVLSTRDSTPSVGSSNGAPGSSPTTTSLRTTSLRTTPNQSAPQSKSVTFRFDALGGSSDIINVYPGVGDSERDHTADGTYRDGQTVKAICITTGRLITSDPQTGELRRRSDKWVRILSQPGTERYATLTYGHLVPAGARLQPCH